MERGTMRLKVRRTDGERRNKTREDGVPETYVVKKTDFERRRGTMGSSLDQLIRVVISVESSC